MATSRQSLWLSWSSGKDSAYALHALQADGRFAVRGLLTAVNAAHARVAMHGVRVELLLAQARAVGIPLVRVELPHPCSNEEYARRLAAALEQGVDDGIAGVAFGDLFLADVRAYRERQLARLGLCAHFPLWGRDTTAMARELLAAGIRARVVCVDPRRCPAWLAGAEYDAELLASLPRNVDPCGENGEFHTFVYDGPEFAQRIPIVPGEVVERDGLLFADLVEGS